jgi:peptidoglycan/LPS O-acetylase OafA/YrhL
MNWLEPSRLRANNFDFLRLTLACLVVFSHAFLVATGDHGNEPLSRFTRGYLSSGGLAVDGFFILSGFLVAHSWTNTRAPLRWLKKRAYRIYPGFIVCVMLCAVVVAPLSTSHPADAFSVTQLKRLAVSLVSLKRYVFSGAFPGNPVPGSVDDSLWSLIYEFACYISLFALGIFGVLGRRVLLLGVFALCLALNGVLSGGPPEAPISGGHLVQYLMVSFRLAALFVGGSVFYFWRDRIPANPFLFLLACLILAISLLAPRSISVVLPICGPYVLLWLAFSPWRPIADLADRIGDWSYGVYLYHFPIQQLIVQQRPDVGPMGLFFVSLPFAALCGGLSWTLVEKWFLRGARRPAPIVADKRARTAFAGCESSPAPATATRATSARAAPTADRSAHTIGRSAAPTAPTPHPSSSESSAVDDPREPAGPAPDS